MVTNILKLGLLLMLSVICVAPVAAQSSAGAIITPPDTESFPEISLFMDVYNDDGVFIHGLTDDEVKVMEDGAQLVVDSLVELRPGVQIVFAINPGPSFAIRNSQGLSRYDYVKEALSSWAQQRQGSSLDDISYLVTGGPSSSHFGDPTSLVAELDASEYDPETTQDSLDTLLQAIDLASDPSPRFGMKRAVIFISSLPEGDPSFALQDLVVRANQAGISIFVWLIAPSEVQASASTDLLTALAQDTGGELLIFSGDSTLPSPEEYLLQLRSAYNIIYESQIDAGGEHVLGARIITDWERIEAASLSFQIDLQPVNIAFISPPALITRQIPPERAREPWDHTESSDLVPMQQQLEVLVDFPDGRPREIIQSRLLVNGEVVDENTSPPYDSFTWDLSSYIASEEHVLRVEADDGFGLVGQSIEMPIAISVDLPKTSVLSMLVSNGPLLVTAIILFTGAILVLVLILGGKLTPRAIGDIVGRRKKRRKATDPVTQPVPVKNDVGIRGDVTGRRLTGWVSRLNWPQRRLSPDADAYLIRVTENLEESTITPIPISSDELTFGRDKNLATLVVNDKSVEALHARLTRQTNGRFLLADEGSVAGTWVNYAPVSGSGNFIEDGDLIHIGRVGFRFKLRNSQNNPTITITARESGE